jgi:hypothetical protein
LKYSGGNGLAGRTDFGDRWLAETKGENLCRCTPPLRSLSRRL